MSRFDRAALSFVPAVLALGLLVAPKPSLAGPGYVNFMIGQKVFDSDDWNPIDKQTSFGVEGAFGPARWPVHLAAYLARSSKSKDAAFNGVQGTLEGTTYEFGFGANKTWVSKKLYPYVSAGIVHAKVDVTVRQSGTSGSDEESGFGGWGGAGVFYRVGSAFNIGGAVRYSAVDVDFNSFTTTIGGVPIVGQTVAAGGLSFGVLLGWGWPPTRK